MEALGAPGKASPRDNSVYLMPNPAWFAHGNFQIRSGGTTLRVSLNAAWFWFWATYRLSMTISVVTPGKSLQALFVRRSPGEACFRKKHHPLFSI